MMVLVDTSIWIDHLREGNHPLSTLLNQDRVLMHEMVAGELACGTLTDRKELLDQFSKLPQIQLISSREVMAFIEDHAVMGKGIGLVDANLLASTMRAGRKIWTRDRKLLTVAIELNLSFDDTTLHGVP